MLVHATFSMAVKYSCASLDVLLLMSFLACRPFGSLHFDALHTLLVPFTRVWFLHDWPAPDVEMTLVHTRTHRHSFNA